MVVLPLRPLRLLWLLLLLLLQLFVLVAKRLRSFAQSSLEACWTIHSVPFAFVHLAQTPTLRIMLPKGMLVAIRHDIPPVLYSVSVLDVKGSSIASVALSQAVRMTLFAG